MTPNSLTGTSQFSANNNKVSLTDVVLKNDVVGGRVVAPDSTSATYEATGNEVKLSGDVKLEGYGVSLHGGLVSNSVSNRAALSGADMYTGNTLVIDNANISGAFDTISNFQTYNFILDLDNAATTVLRANNIDLTDPNDPTKNATINTLNTYGGKINFPGDSIELLSASNSLKVNSGYSQQVVGYQGAMIIYDYSVAVDPTDSKKLKATVVGMRINPRSGALAEIPIANLAFLNAAADVVASYTIPAAQTSLIGNQGYGVYGTLGYSTHRYHTGSHVDVKGLSGQLGLSAGTDNGNNQIVAALFFEFGRGEYETYNLFGADEVRANGDVSYLGLGVAGRFDFGPEFSSHPYIEASARLGKSRFDFNTTDLQISGGANINYEFDSKYYGFHGGLGFILDLNQLGTTMDISAKYLFTEREASNLTLFGETVSLQKSQSSRIRAGARLTFGMSDSIKPYAGGYYEYESDGDTVVSVRGYPLSIASLKGSTGIGEIGILLESLNIPIKFEAGVQGTGGKRDGLGGNMRLSYAF
jgi:hypothetical protein